MTAEVLSSDTSKPASIWSKYAALQLSKMELLCLALMALGLLARFFARPHAPFWIDEAATGSVISEESFSTFIRDVRWHVSSPLYFLFLREWAHAFGLDNIVLRLPSAIFSVLAPLVILCTPVQGVSRLERINWAALVALWMPGIGFGQAARPYALEFLFATAQTVAFARLLTGVNLRSACLWVGLSALTISTHYLAAPLALMQGLIFLVVHRWDAVKQWPSLVLLLPALAIMAWQAPEMLRFMQPGTSWYRLYKLPQVIDSYTYFFGLFIVVAGLGVALVAAAWRRLKASDGRPYRPTILIWAGAASLMGATILIVFATQRPMMTDRYLVPFAPGVLLLVQVLLSMMARASASWVAAATVIPFYLGFAAWMAAGARHPDSVVEELNYEHASNDIMKSGARSLVFVWDNPNAQAMHLEQIEEYGRFFFKRAGYDIDVIPVRPNPRGDTNQLLTAAAHPKGSAILWVYDNWVLQTSARTHPPRLEQFDPSLKCRLTKKKSIGILTCVRI